MRVKQIYSLLNKESNKIDHSKVIECEQIIDCVINKISKQQLTIRDEIVKDDIKSLLRR